MRRTIARRGLAFGIGLIAAAGLVVGCGDDSDDSASSPTSPAAATTEATTTTEAAADPAVTKAITDNFQKFFDGKTPPAERAALIEKGPEFQPVLEGLTKNPQSLQTTVAVKDVKLVDATKADVTFDLLLDGNPVMPDQAGQAIKDGETWKVAAATFCALMSVQGGGAQIPACA